KLKALLVEQLTAPVRWAETMASVSDAGVTQVIEIGPGKVLAGLAKRAMRPEKLVNLDRLEQVTAFLEVQV
ncbi:MAG: ACP S-malonyltransferase, partial [Candidatus Zixiibacteriota bacterium]